MADITLDETQEVIIRDSTTSNNELKVNSDGSINVVTTTSNLGAANEAFLASYEGSVSTSEVPVLLLRNPSNSTKYVFIDAFILSAVTGGRIIWCRGYEMPVITANGTTVNTHSVTKQGTEPTASLLLTHTPTVSSNGERNFVLTSGQFQLSLPVKLDPIVVLYPNTAFLITAISSGNNSAFAIDLRWRELV